MKKQILGLAAATLAVPAVAFGQSGTETSPPPPTESPSPNAIVAGAPASEWMAIDAEDLLVMTLALDRDGNERKVVIQLMPAPFSQGWVENIRKLARAKWYDGISVNRVQDNYVVQWGDPGHDNPEGEGIETKPLPEGLRVMGESEYEVTITEEMRNDATRNEGKKAGDGPSGWTVYAPGDSNQFENSRRSSNLFGGDPYAYFNFSYNGWPISFGSMTHAWPIHCYGMVGVGRNFSPDTGSGAELYTVIGHAPRHLDRNIALAGRIIDGMEHLSSLPRGSGTLGFYTEDEAELRTPILSIRVASDLPEAERPQFEYLSTEGETFAKYADARANRRDPFFIVPAGGADICNIPVPIRAVTSDSGE
jgi:cyclophilin family peptidyl-prolyl cis-trans isomerase